MKNPKGSLFVVVVGCFSLTWSSIAGCNPQKDAGTSATGASKSGVPVEIVSLKNRAVALLENGAESDKNGKLLSEAADGFRKIAKDIPKDPLGLQNLCIALLSRLKQSDQGESSDTSNALRRELKDSIESLRKMLPDAPDADVLESRYLQLVNERESAIQKMRAATSRMNATADTHYQLAQLLRAELGNATSDEIRTCLESAIKLAPNNLVLAAAYVDALAKASNPKLIDEISRCRELFQSLTARTNSSITKLLDKGSEAASKSDWRTAQTQMAFLRNVLLAEVAYQNDMNLLEPHVLEYIRLNFQTATQVPVSTNAGASTKLSFDQKPLSIDIEGVTSIASEDFDLDGVMDLVIATQGGITVFGSKSKSEFTALLSNELDIKATGIVLADLDHDFQLRKDELPPSALPTTNPPDVPPSSTANLVDTDVDLVAFGSDGIRLFKNELDKESGKRTLIAMPQAEDFSALKGIQSVAVIDLDHDSDLDMCVSSNEGVSLWSNRGDWTFANFTAYSSFPKESRAWSSIAALDLDRNVLNDFLLGSEDGLPVMLANSLHGRYQVRDLSWPKELSGACRSVEAIDVNSDACWDIISCGKAGLFLTTMKSPGHRRWVPDSTVKLSTKPMTGLTTCDFDNDGLMDCVSWGLRGMELFRGNADGQMVLDPVSLSTPQPITQCVVMDFDQDGDDDMVFLLENGKPQSFVNQGGNANKSLEVVLRADEEGKQRPRERCNMHGVGSLLELKSGGRYQSRIVRGTRTKLGLGAQSEADLLRIVWTNGIPNNVLNLANRSTIFDQQNLGGSCPYLYAWNGERFEFCTDCLWAAPIGLQFAQGVAAPTREWEYLKIDGSAIQPRDGKYILQVTEELWEAAYFDAVQLIAIDHPKEIDVYTNEKVGPPDVAQFRVHTVKNRLIPKSVTDQKGKDWSTTVAKRDQQFTRCWEIGFNQGLVETHWLEIDLNESRGNSEELTLFLTGWVFPTCTSLNLAMTENPLRPRLKPPAIHVPDRDGNWVEVVPYAGFPGGKTKTIAMDLTGKFLSEDHRVRIVTNMELCWDEVFFTRGEVASKPEDFRLSPLNLERAELRYRGFSELIAQSGNAPKRYEYNKVTAESIWPPMSGAFTRFGEVTELVATADDMQVVMGAGDELTLEFPVGTDPLPEGWVRDFILYNVGWDKDADLNTIHGQQVEPLPFRGMTQYPYEPDQSFPSTPKHEEYLRKYQTREQNLNSFWNQVRDAL